MPVGTENCALSAQVVRAIQAAVHERYRQNTRPLPFHGWHHIEFVRHKALEFAGQNGADVSIVEAAALVHDLNYLVARNSRAAAGAALRQSVLGECGLSSETVDRIERVVQEAETSSRGPHISLEAQALSDADTLFKVLPITPVVLAHRYMAETGVGLATLAEKITRDQIRLRDEGIYFYNEAAAAHYEAWAAANLNLWSTIVQAVREPAVQHLLAQLD